MRFQLPDIKHRDVTILQIKRVFQTTYVRLFPIEEDAKKEREREQIE